MVKNTNWVPISVSIDLVESVENFVNSKEGKRSGYTSKSGFVADAIREKLESLTGDTKNQQTNIESMLIELQDKMNFLVHLQSVPQMSKEELSDRKKYNKEREEYLKKEGLKPYNFNKNRKTKSIKDLQKLENKSIIVSETIYDKFHEDYQKSKDDLMMEGINSFAGYVTYRLEEMMQSKEKKSKIEKKIKS